MDDRSRGNTPGASGTASSTGGSGPQTSNSLPAPLAPAPPGGQVATTTSQLSKRRRGLGIVTPNACTECRKKRAKCDGQTPCGRCRSQRGVECVYEIPIRQTKENLRTEIEQLRTRQRSSDTIFAALTRNDLWEDVLQRLRNGEPVESISDWLDDVLPSGGGAMPSLHGDLAMGSGGSMPGLAGFAASGPGSLAGMNLVGTASPVAHSIRHDVDHNSPWHFSSQSHSERSSCHPDPMNWTADHRGPPMSRVGSWAESMDHGDTPENGQRYRGLDQVLAPPESPQLQVQPETWTDITSDDRLVQHLLALYFCWEYPTFASLSKEHFLRDFRHGSSRYCSPILVNALLALGCRFSTQPNTRANPNDPYSSGDHFFRESQRLFAKETNHHRLTTIQALGIMSIREASCGRDSESWYYGGQSIRLAIEMGLHRVQDEADEDELAVRAATFWGAFALDHAWSLATGSLPQCSCFPHLPLKPAIIDDIEASLWIPYTDDGAPLQRSCQQPSNVRSVYKCFCELSELVHQSLYILHSPGRPLTSRDLLSIYTQYLNWYDRIPEVLRLGHNFTPAVLFAHMYYHFAILLLFRPLIKLRIVGSSVAPRDVCSQAADAIQGLLRSYSQLYTLRRTPSFVPYFVLTSSIMHLAIGASSIPIRASEPATPSGQHIADPTAAAAMASKLDPKVAESINQGIADLTEMAPCHGFAEQALNILRYLAKKWHLDVDMGGAKAPEDVDRLVRPHSSSLNFFAPNVREEDFMCLWGSGTSVVASTNSAALVRPTTSDLVPPGPTPAPAPASMDNPLFWPFPMQGRPLLPAGACLEEAGFALL